MRLDKRNTHLLIYHFAYHIIYHFVYLYFSTIVRQVLLYIIKEVDRSEDLQSQQLVNLQWVNPGPINKLSLIIFPSLWFFKVPSYNGWKNLK